MFALRSKKPEKILTVANINENVKKCKYDVRGEIYLAAVKRTNEGKDVIYTNVGNPQALGQVKIELIIAEKQCTYFPFLRQDPVDFQSSSYGPAHGTIFDGYT